jgi:hypothetical protein
VEVAKSETLAVRKHPQHCWSIAGGQPCMASAKVRLCQSRATYLGIAIFDRCIKFMGPPTSDVVNNLEGQARRLVAHCGLDWDDACPAFHKT